MQPAWRPRPIWPILLVASALLVLVIVLVGLFWFANGPSGPYGYRHAAFGWFGGLLVILLIVWIGFMILRITWWTHRRWGGPYGRGPGPGHDPAPAIARARYARGEISREQFDQIMSDLDRRRMPPP